MNSEQQVTVRGAPAAIEAWLQTLAGPITEGWSRRRHRTESEGESRRPMADLPGVVGGRRSSPDGRLPTASFRLRGRRDERRGDRPQGTGPRRSYRSSQSFRDALVAPRGNELQLDRTPGIRRAVGTDQPAGPGPIHGFCSHGQQGIAALWPGPAALVRLPHPAPSGRGQPATRGPGGGSEGGGVQSRGH